MLLIFICSPGRWLSCVKRTEGIISLFFPGFWLQVWLIGDGILASAGFINDIDHYYLYSGKGEWGGFTAG